MILTRVTLQLLLAAAAIGTTNMDAGCDHSHKGVIACASQSNVIRMVNTSIRPAFLRRIEDLFSAPNPSIHAANTLLVTART